MNNINTQIFRSKYIGIFYEDIKYIDVNIQISNIQVSCDRYSEPNEINIK